MTSRTAPHRASRPSDDGRGRPAPRQRSRQNAPPTSLVVALGLGAIGLATLVAGAIATRSPLASTLASAAPVAQPRGVDERREILPARRYPDASAAVPATGVRERIAGYDPFALPLSPPDPGERLDDCPPRRRPSGSPYEFYFSRAAYSGFETFGYASWSVDYPKADRQFLLGVERLMDRLDHYPCENPVLLDDPRLREYPFLYAVEVGKMTLRASEREGLRNYLLSGGFLMIDDFWGSAEWRRLEEEFQLVLPEFPIEEVDMDHPIFHGFYDIETLVQVPNVGLGRRGGRTHEKDGFVPHVRGIFDQDRRLMVLINWNCDLGDAWEWAEDPFYPLEYSTYAYQIGVNAIVYAMTH
ncbi:MAG: DUF4159 domain-containing protein [Acidobacteria bacterium]|nr:MAG: DUF4159 domain-containing protein [Acidobacteriota bacterium]REK00182.1 MAG: DUF4159 domain-containing protein [Acidobacteriota bacterium]